MKKIHFLENDYKCPSSDDIISYGKQAMNYNGIPKELIKEMEIHYQFHLKEKEDIYKIIFNKGNILSTYSVYVSGSDVTFIKFITSAAKNRINGITYLDNSGCIINFLNRSYMTYEKYFLDLAVGINSNNILTVNRDDDSAEFNYYKVEIVIPENHYDDIVKLHKVSKEELEELLK